MSMMHVDSCFLLCSTVGRAIKAGEKTEESLDDHTRELFSAKCKDSEDFEQKGDQMMKDLTKVMEQQDGDASLVWKASIMHHMMFGLHYSDYGDILKKFLPMIQKHKYDIYFNGHEH